ncbi:hypothetical protein H696_04452 [Fonticula alba]|uniref:Uncharacterized protein n=1 Tax=Fonticula alba TaxID=691883 RepID=A0A058Z6A1_FONAL|nr:hypothetical protein H696_04452 [Fonticula alba]KCV69032.1 hypothetical protein H696_04452 [Fonticula alba]|eukprot:XP_009496603.1 hypothetical protein H696_04452 [Fonticula alba]
MNDLFRIVEHGDVATLKEIIHSGSIDINACIADGSTILHYACTIGNPAIVSTLLSHPNIILDATNSDGNTPLHVAAAYTHLAIVKLLIKAGNTPHSIFSHNIKGKLPIDYAVHPEVHSYLESCMSIHDQIYNFTPDPNVLKKYIIDLTIEWSEFQLRAQEVIHEQIEQKQIALHKLHLVERATGVTDSNGAASVIDHLALLQDENDRLTSELMEIRRKMAILEEHLQEHERSEANDASAGDADAPAETAGSSPAAAGASEDSVNMLNTAYENQARVDAEDEKNGLIVYVKNASSETSPNTRRQIRGATKEKLVARLAAYGGPSERPGAPQNMPVFGA